MAVELQQNLVDLTQQGDPRTRRVRPALNRQGRLIRFPIEKIRTPSDQPIPHPEVLLDALLKEMRQDAIGQALMLAQNNALHLAQGNIERLVNTASQLSQTLGQIKSLDMIVDKVRVVLSPSINPPIEKPSTTTPLFEHLYQQTHYKLCGTLIRHGLTHEEAEDVFQESFIKLFKKYPDATLEQAKKLLNAIVFNQKNDLGREKKRKPQTSLDQPQGNPQIVDSGNTLANNIRDSGLNAEDTLVIKDEVDETNSLLKQVLAELPTEQRAVIEFVYLHNHKYTQASETLGLPLNTIKSHIRRGKERLRKGLQKHGISSSRIGIY